MTHTRSTHAPRVRVARPHSPPARILSQEHASQGSATLVLRDRRGTASPAAARRARRSAAARASTRRATRTIATAVVRNAAAASAPTAPASSRNALQHRIVLRRLARPRVALTASASTRAQRTARAAPVARAWTASAGLLARRRTSAPPHHC